MGFNMLKNWPPYLPDLNPIEHLWFHLKELVYELHPELLTMGGDDDTKKVALRGAIAYALDILPERKPYLIPGLYESFKRRLEAYKAVQGGPTLY